MQFLRCFYQCKRSVQSVSFFVQNPPTINVVPLKTLITKIAFSSSVPTLGAAGWSKVGCLNWQLGTKILSLFFSVDAGRGVVAVGGLSNGQLGDDWTTPGPPPSSRWRDPNTRASKQSQTLKFIPPPIPSPRNPRNLFKDSLFFNGQSESRVKGCCVQERGKTKLGLGRYISSFLGRSWSKVTCFNQSKLKSRSLYFFCGRCFCVSKLSIWGSGYSISKQVQTRIIFQCRWSYGSKPSHADLWVTD